VKVGLFCLFEHFEGSVQTSLENQLRLVEYADELGFDEAWFGEHHFNGFSVCPSPSVLLSYAVARTKRIRLGAAGHLAPFYDPVRLAEDIATLDNLSGGRINFGVAKGAFAPDSKHFKTRPDDLRGVMFETVEAACEILKNSKASYAGEFISIDAVQVHPRPVQASIPVFVASFGNEESIEFAARHGFCLMGSQGVSIDEAKEIGRIYEKTAGYKPQIVLMRTFCVADSYDEAYSISRPSIDHFVKSMRAASSYEMAPIWDRERYKELVKERVAFFDGEKFFREGIIGTVDECIEKIRTIQKELPNVTIALKPTASYFETNKEMLRIFNEKIRPFI
jgi:alkanesulfonate monooxygenase SsuD/methylene tetrahydromethanopterin reductase-like flavin-dependent oxidoreductase (luciferase family)